MVKDDVGINYKINTINENKMNMNLDTKELYQLTKKFI